MSDVKYDPELCERLIREARADDQMLAAFSEFGDSYLIRTKHGAYGTASVVAALKREAAMADQLDAARREVERVTRELNHAIVENLAFNVKVSGEINETRAEREYWRTQTAIMLARACTGDSSECAIRQRCTNKCGRLQQLDDAYRAAKGKTGT